MLDHFIIKFLGVRWMWRVHYFADVRLVGRPRPDINVSWYLAFLLLTYNNKVGEVLGHSRSFVVVITLGIPES